ncbi:MAG TPA: Stk1 family PASTA domain-containing Ser/Thr kinase, partial [Solirubrobacteraceae bacterium]|nr:Stk1 family PASTA domain-containing Ser/Thr kinase [Solirubrobacteraceae bacterium]
ISRLGSGGMADVFLAEDHQLGRKVALKLLHRRFAEDPGFVERFRREAQAAAGLQHPNVVSVYDRGEFDGTYYIAMEYLPGRTLKQLIREEAPLDPVRAIDITVEILKAARFAHRRGVIHRDLKPHNVIIDENDTAKVTDFGIARAGASDMTETGSIMGTAQYLSPEQAQGHVVSAGSDLYSVGVVLYELLTGRVPFDAEAAVTIALKHVSEAPTPPSVINPAVPPDLERVVLWTLDKDPARRPADADQLIAALEEVRSEIVSGAKGQRTAELTALGVGVGFAEVPATAAYAGTAPDGALVPAPWEDPAAADGDQPPDDDERRSRRWLWIALAAAVILIGGGVAAYLLTRPAKNVVPSVVNQTLNDARTVLQNDGFGVSVLYVTDNHPAGTVIGQSPLAGARADNGSTVNLTVSNGPGSVNVPSVSGLTGAQAKQELKQARLKVGRTVTEPSSTVASGDATRTDPQSGQSLPVGSSVTLFVSSGPAAVPVPDVTGQSQSNATSLLQSQGFSVTTSTQESTTVQPGNVISQSPAGGTRVQPNATVNLVIAKASTTTTVPDVKGSTATAARSALSGAGFTVTEKAQDTSKQNEDGIVLSQSPASGQTVKKGSTVTIVVGHYKPTTTTTTTTTTPPPTTTT